MGNKIMETYAKQILNHAQKTRVEELAQEAADHEELARLREENKELNHLFEMEYAREIEAKHLWHLANPGRELTSPDYGSLLIFLMDMLDKKLPLTKEVVKLSRLKQAAEWTIRDLKKRITELEAQIEREEGDVR
jgi:cell fate (sporulation/competence/biofilm development) regulator YlbF (YheA/YmcA/DUF963 family)